jgi:hypothetical protein
MSSTQSYQTNSSSESENSPLVPASSPPDSNNNGNFYFLGNRRESLMSTTSRTPAGEEGEVVEKLPYGATEEEFASRPVMVSFDSCLCNTNIYIIFSHLACLCREMELTVYQQKERLSAVSSLDCLGRNNPHLHRTPAS